MNIAISRVCNQTCAYCFTADHLADSPRPGERFIRIAMFQEYLAFLVRSGASEVRLLGGEPTLHPAFPQLVSLACDAGLHITLFTNGLIPEPALACLVDLDAEQCTVVVNVNEPSPTTTMHDRRRGEALRRLGERALIGFTIAHNAFQPGFLAPLAVDAGCRPQIRVGLAQPCISGTNQSITPNQYPAIGRRIVAWARDAARYGVRLSFDCGFVPCMFTAEERDDLAALGAKLGWHCSPVLDVDLDGLVIACYPLSRMARMPLSQARSLSELRAFFVQQAAPYRRAGISPGCADCPHAAAALCPGGCLAATIRRFRHNAFAVCEEPCTEETAP